MALRSLVSVSDHGLSLTPVAYILHKLVQAIEKGGINRVLAVYLDR